MPAVLHALETYDVDLLAEMVIELWTVQPTPGDRIARVIADSDRSLNLLGPKWSGILPYLQQRVIRRRRTADQPGSEVWDRVLERLETKVDRHAYYTWLKPIVCISDVGGVLTLRAPTIECQRWIEKHHAADITASLAEVGRPDAAIAWVT